MRVPFSSAILDIFVHVYIQNRLEIKNLAKKINYLILILANS